MSRTLSPEEQKIIDDMIDPVRDLMFVEDAHHHVQCGFRCGGTATSLVTFEHTPTCIGRRYLETFDRVSRTAKESAK